MAVSGITNSNSILIAARRNRVQVPVRPIPPQPGALNLAPAVAPATPGVDPLRQNFQTINIPPPNVGLPPPAPIATQLAAATIPPPVAPPVAAGLTPPLAVPPMAAAAIPTPLVSGAVPGVVIMAPAPVALFIPLQNVTLAVAVPFPPPLAAAAIPPPVAPLAAPELTIMAPAPVLPTIPSANGTLVPAVPALAAAAIPTTVAPGAAPELVILPPAPVALTIPLANATLAAATPAAAPLAEGAFAAPVAPPAAAIAQNELLVNEILRKVGSPAAGPASPLLIDSRSPLLTALEATGGLNLIQQIGLQVNETLANLGFAAAEPVSPLLIDAFPPALEAAAITADLGPIQENALFVSETLQDLGSRVLRGDQVQARPDLAAPAMAVAGERVAATAGEAALAPPAVDLTVAAAVPVVAPVTAAAAASVPATATPGAGGEVTLPVTALFLTQELTPTTLPVVLFPDRIPYVLVVYQINDPAPLPSRLPEPIDVDVPPAAAIAQINAVGNSRLRQAQFRARARERTGSIEYSETLGSVAQVERSIRHGLDLVNADMAAHNRPFHLVFAKHDSGFALDVYDCSYSDACRMTYDVPISVANLAGLLDNLEHETGIIVDTDS